MGSRAAYFPQLDGFRAIAVILVLLVHSGFFLFNAGWIGVPIFFVLSGFLITRILLNAKTSQHYFRAFYSRRILRIFPIYYLVLFFCLAWGITMKSNVSQFYYYVFYMQSFTISHNVQPPFCNGLMGHTWSLSVEELFYLVWPAVIYFFSRKQLISLCVLLSLFSFSYKIIQIFYGTEQTALLSGAGNLDCLMAGSFLSLYVCSGQRSFAQTQRKWLILILVLTLSLIGAQYFQFPTKILFLCKILLSVSTAWLSFFVILFFVSKQQHSPEISRFFSNRVLIYIGKISYGLYLYHMLIYRFISSCLFHYKMSLDPIFELFLKISITFLVSVISWHLIEKPLLSLKERLTY